MNRSTDGHAADGHVYTDTSIRRAVARSPFGGQTWSWAAAHLRFKNVGVGGENHRTIYGAGALYSALGTTGAGTEPWSNRVYP